MRQKTTPYQKHFEKSEGIYSSSCLCLKLAAGTSDWVTNLCPASVSRVVASQLQWGGVWAGAPRVWKSLQIEDCLQTVKHKRVLEWHWLCGVVLGTVALLIRTITNYIVQGSNLLCWCFCDSYRLKASVYGLSTKPQARKSSCSQVTICSKCDAESAVLVLCSWSAGKQHVWHLGFTAPTQRIPNHMFSEKGDCTARGAELLHSPLLQAGIPAVAAVPWGLGWLLSWAMLHSSSFWLSIQRLWLGVRSSWLQTWAPVNVVSELQLC